MNWLYLAAGLLSIAVAVVHSILGELWVFKRMRRGTLVPTNGGNVLREPHVRILWASWHVLSVFGLVLAAMLVHSAYRPSQALAPPVITIAMAMASAMVGFGTRGKHLGWVGLLGVAVLSALGFALGQ
jgi:hypothetical protein